MQSAETVNTLRVFPSQFSATCGAQDKLGGGGGLGRVGLFCGFVQRWVREINSLKFTLLQKTSRLWVKNSYKSFFLFPEASKSCLLLQVEF